MADTLVKIDRSRLDERLKHLTEGEIDLMLMRAVNDGGAFLQKATINNFLSCPIKGQHMVKGIVLRKSKQGDYPVATVNIMRHPLLHIFEKGTYKSGVRKHADGSSTGSISAQNFFARARNDVQGIQNAIFAKLDQQLKKANL